MQDQGTAMKPPHDKNIEMQQQTTSQLEQAAKMQSIATQYERMSDSSRASSQLNHFTQQQMDLMKKKVQY